jgi:hypothetical protein
MKLHLTLAAFTVTAVLAGCAVFQPPPLAVGQTEADVAALLGGPTARYAMPDGSTRLEFATGPYGRQTWMVDLGPDGRSRAFRQVLERRQLWAFAERAQGLTVDQLLRELGSPAERRHGGLAGGQTWSWRYPTNDCLWWQVSVGADGRVIGAGEGIDPACDAREPFSRD